MGEIIVMLLATYAASVVTSQYEGPYHLFSKIREKYPDSVFVCAVCISFWFASVFYLLLIAGLTAYIVPIAVVGVVILLEKL